MAESPNEGNIEAIIRALYGSADRDIGAHGDALIRYLEGLGREFEGLHRIEGERRGAPSAALQQVWAIPRASLASQKALGATRTSNLRQGLAASGAGMATQAATQARSARERELSRAGQEKLITGTRESSRQADIEFTQRMRQGGIDRADAEYRGRQALARTEFEGDKELKRLQYEFERAERDARKREEEEARRRAEEEMRRAEEEMRRAEAEFTGGGRGRGRGRGGGGKGGGDEKVNAKIQSMVQEYMLSRDPKTGGFIDLKTGRPTSGTAVMRNLFRRYLVSKGGLAEHGFSANDIRAILQEVANSMSWSVKNYGKYAATQRNKAGRAHASPGTRGGWNPWKYRVQSGRR